jgi:hypothetical protein
MLDDVIEFTIHCIFELVCFFTGEIVLYLLTFGKRKPRWDYYEHEKPYKWAIFTELSMYIGFAFWVAVAALIVNVILK